MRKPWPASVSLISVGHGAQAASASSVGFFLHYLLKIAWSPFRIILLWSQQSPIRVPYTTPHRALIFGNPNPPEGGMDAESFWSPHCPRLHCGPATHADNVLSSMQPPWKSRLGAFGNVGNRICIYCLSLYTANFSSFQN